MSAQPQNPVVHDSILIIDFGSQVTQLIARRVREIGVYCEIAPFQSASEAFARMKPKGVIFSGGPASVPDEGSPRAPEAVFSANIPLMGICYGQQTMAHQLGGKVEGGHAAEFGRADRAVLVGVGAVELGGQGRQGGGFVFAELAVGVLVGLGEGGRDLGVGGRGLGRGGGALRVGAAGHPQGDAGDQQQAAGFERGETDKSSGHGSLLEC